MASLSVNVVADSGTMANLNVYNSTSIQITNLTLSNLACTNITSTNINVSGSSTLSHLTATNITVGNLKVTGSSIFSTTTVTDLIISGTLKQPSGYVLASTFVAYGDSFTAGTGSESATTWPAMLATLSGSTAINKAVGGTCIDKITSDNPMLTNDIIMTAAYDNYSYIIAYGFNDVRQTDALFIETNLYQWYQVYLNAAITMAMKQANFNIARTGWTETGSWSNTPVNSYGRYTATNGGSSTKTITGRYYMFSFVVTGTASWQIQIDGVNKTYGNFTYRDGIASYYSYCTMVDMGSTAARSVKVINNTSINNHFEFCAAWDDTSSFRNVMCCSIPLFDFTYTGGSPYTGGTLAKWNSMNTLIQKAVITCQHLGLPVYFYKDTNMNCFDADGLHWSDGSYYQRAYGIYSNI